MRRLRDSVPVEPGMLEGFRSARIRNRSSGRRILKLRKAREFPASAFGDGSTQFRAEVAEKEKGRHGAEFLAHEDERRRRRKQYDGRRGRERPGIDELREPVAERA